MLVTRESGTGKEVIARCIHRASATSSSPSSRIVRHSQQLLESELFGYATSGESSGCAALANTSGDVDETDEYSIGGLFRRGKRNVDQDANVASVEGLKS